MKSLMVVSAVLSGTAVAGGTGGGSTPPSVLDEMILNMRDTDFMAVVTDNEPFLVTGKPLVPSMKLSAGPQDADALRISKDDLIALARMKNIDVINPIDSSRGSYRVDDGGSLDSFVLTDRRELVRNAVSKN